MSNSLRLDIGSFGDLHVTRVDPIADAGGYTCIVTAPTGETFKKDLQVVVKSTFAFMKYFIFIYLISKTEFQFFRSSKISAFFISS